MVTHSAHEERVFQALRESEERYRLVCLATNDVIYEWDVESDQINIAGGSVGAVLGHSLPAGGATRECWWDRLHPGDREEVLAKHAKWLRTGGCPWSEEYRVRRRDGHYSIVWDRAHAVRDEYGRVVRVVGSLTDLTALRRAEERNRVLAEASRHLAEARLDWSKVLDCIVDLVTREIGDLCLMSMVSADGTWLDPVAIRHRGAAQIPPTDELELAHPSRVGEGLLGRVALTGQPRLLAKLPPELVDGLMAPPSTFHSEGGPLKSAVIVPLISRGVVVGTLFVARGEGSQPFTIDDQRFLEELAHRASAAVDCAQLHREAIEAQDELVRALDRERTITDQLQRCFRSELPQRLPGYTLGHVYQTALDEARIGGDFYDIFPLGAGRYGVLMGDVSGKGIEAAVVTVKARYYLRGYAAEYTDPVEVVRLLNEVLYRDLEGEAFVTLFYGVLTPATHKLVYVTAGHELPLLLVDDEVHPLHTTGPLLGISPDLGYESRELEIPPGASLLLYTDGATEARTDGRFLGMRGLADRLVRRARSASGQGLVERLASDIEEFARGYLSDDMALMLLQRDN